MKQEFAPQLVALTEGSNISLDKPILLVGRHQECDVQIVSRKISRRHCCIALVNDHLVVRDLGSTNGIRINGVKVLEGNLQPDDELTIGNVRYQLKLAAEAEHNSKGPHTNGIQAAPPAPALDHDESYDVPMPLAEDGTAIPILESQPKAPANEGTNGAAEKPYPPDYPDNIDLVPLQPPPS